MLEQRPGSEDLDLPSFADDEDRDEDEKIEAAQKRARRRRRYITIAVVLLIIILVPVIFFATRGLRMRRVTYQFRQVTQGNIALVVSATGPVQGTIYNADFLATGRVSEIDVKLGQSVNAYGSRTFHGTVSAIAPLGQNASNVVTYPVTINVDMKSIPGANVLPGMTASVTITIATHSNALLVPVDAINFAQASTQISSSERDAALSQAQQMMAGLQSGGTGGSKSNMTASFVLEQANNRWTAKPVVLGLTDGTSYEVLSGLTLGESVAVGVQGGTGGTTGPVGRPGTGIGG